MKRFEHVEPIADLAQLVTWDAFLYARRDRDRAFVRSFWALHLANVLRGCDCGWRGDPDCPLGQTARRLGIAA